MKKYHVAHILTAGLLWAANAPADIVWSGEQNLSGYEQYIDLNSDSLIDLALAYWIIIPDGFYPEGTSAVLKAQVDGFPVDGTSRILVEASNGQNAALPYGTLVSSTPDVSLEWKGGLYAEGSVSGWSTYPPEPDTEWSGLLGETGEAYLGISFDIGDATHYGWVHVVLGEEDSLGTGFRDPVTASWAYESTPDTPIVAGVIPEPSTGILTMVGSIGLLFIARSRRRR
jgi:hypothetical protein